MQSDVRIVVQSLNTRERRILVQGAATARYASPGYLVYLQNGSLMAAPFDSGRLELTGTPVPVVEDVAERLSAGFSFSRLGWLVYIPQVYKSWTRTLVLVDRKGSLQSLALPPRDYMEPRFSPDGRRLAVCNRGDGEIWLYDLPHETPTRLTFSGNNCFPLWFSDGKRVAFASHRAGRWAIFSKSADGTGPEEPLLRRVARVADGWLPQVDPVEPLMRLRGYLTEASRDPSGFGVTWRLIAGPGGPESWVETVRQMESVGVTDVTISAPPDVTGAPSLQRIIEARQALVAAGY